MTTSTRLPSGMVGNGPSSIMPEAYRDKRTGDPVSRVARLRGESYGVTPRGSLRGRGGDAEMGTHFVASPPSTKTNHKRSLAPSTMVSSPDHELIPAHEFFCSRKLRA